MISIIMPFFNHYDLVHRRLYELWQLHPEDYEIILINDASTDTGFEGNIGWWQNTVKSPLNLRYHKNAENLGFVGSMNLGAKNAIGDILIFFSDDVVISGNFLNDVRSIYAEHPNALIGGRKVDWSAGWNQIEYKGQMHTIPYLEGWFIACSKETWNILGGFDPIYAPSDYEDVDLSTTALYLGIPMIVLDGSKLIHLGAQSYGYTPLREARTMENREKYLKKWAGKWGEVLRV